VSLNANEAIKVRIRFSRSGDARFVSHLDQLRSLARAVNRSGVPVWNTEGFNPHPHLVFANPLSVGFTADSEIMDIRLVEPMEMDEVKRRLNDAMPPFYAVTDAYIRETKPVDIAYALYKITMTAENMTAKQLYDGVKAMLERDEIWVEKSAKRSTAETNIRPMIKTYELNVDGSDLKIETVLSASSTEFLNPTYLFRAMERYIKDFELDYSSICRSTFYTADMKEFK